MPKNVLNCLKCLKISLKSLIIMVSRRTTYPEQDLPRYTDALICGKCIDRKDTSKGKIGWNICFKTRLPTYSFESSRATLGNLS